MQTHWPVKIQIVTNFEKILNLFCLKTYEINSILVNEKRKEETNMIRKPDYIMGDLHLKDRGMFARVYSKTFNTPDEHSAAIVTRWNKKVTRKDAVVYILGDIGQKEEIAKIIPQLNGHLILILGNHDNLSKAFYEEYFDEVYSSSVWVTARILLSHIPQPVGPGYLNFHGHTHMVKLASKWHYNMCPEWWDYTPVLFKKLEGYLGRILKPNDHFMEEWYADIQEWHGEDRDELHFVGDSKLLDVEKTKKAVFEFKYARKLKQAEEKRIAESLLSPVVLMTNIMNESVKLLEKK